MNVQLWRPIGERAIGPNVRQNAAMVFEIEPFLVSLEAFRYVN